MSYLRSNHDNDEDIFNESDSSESDSIESDSIEPDNSNNKRTKYNKQPDQNELDPLDIYMNTLDQSSVSIKQKHQVVEVQDGVDVYIDYIENQNKKYEGRKKDTRELGNDDNEMEDYNSDDLDNDETTGKLRKNKMISQLEPIDHNNIEYYEFQKDFYSDNIHIDMVLITEDQINNIKKSLDINISGRNPPTPVISFGYLLLDQKLIDTIIKLGYSSPTPIQAQTFPCLLSGRDCIVISKTGSGKTAAYLVPMIVHIMDQPIISSGDGPIALVLAPTRELCYQIESVASKFARPFNIKVVSIFGGLENKYEQLKILKQGCEIIIATPGRLIDLLRMKATNLFRITYFIIDEADIMFDLGFGPQVHSIIGQIRPDAQTALFSATMKRKVENLACEIVTNPLRINCGSINTDIKQVVEVFNDISAKYSWLLHHLPSFLSKGPVLIFTSTIAQTEELATKMNLSGSKVSCIHGNKSQYDRLEILRKFKNNEINILVATDVASRGLDIKLLKTVINFDIAKDLDAHTHRIGRTGRAGAQDGTAFTLVLTSESKFAGVLIDSLEISGQFINPSLLEVASKNIRFNKSHTKLFNVRPKRASRFGPFVSIASTSLSITKVYAPPNNLASDANYISNVKQNFNNSFTRAKIVQVPSNESGIFYKSTTTTSNAINNNETVETTKRKSRWN